MWREMETASKRAVTPKLVAAEMVSAVNDLPLSDIDEAAQQGRLGPLLKQARCFVTKLAGHRCRLDFGLNMKDSEGSKKKDVWRWT